MTLLADPEGVTVTEYFCTPNREGRLTWLIVLALQRADTPQRETLERCYGTGSEQDAQRVREVYDKLNLAKTFRSAHSYNLLKSYRVIQS